MNEDKQEIVSEVKSPEQTIQEVISIFRQTSMETNDILNAGVVIISKQGVSTPVPIPFPILKSDFGMSLFKTFIKNLNKEDIHSVVEMAFGFGVVKSLRGEDHAKEKFEKLKKEVEEITKEDRENIKNHAECQQYMLVNVCTSESVLLNFYDVIRTSNNDATVISNEPVVKEEIKHGKYPQLTNYFL